MANRVMTYVDLQGIGRDMSEGKFDITKDYNCCPVKCDGPDSIIIESQWRPPLVSLSGLSKDVYPGQDIEVTYLNEGNPCTESQLKLRDGAITGERSRYNDGFDTPDPFGDWKPVSQSKSADLIANVERLDKREQRARQAAAISAGVSVENENSGLEM